MKKKISLLLCAGLLLSMLTGCSGGKLDFSWFTSKFTGKTADQTQAEQEAAAAKPDIDKAKAAADEAAKAVDAELLARYKRIKGRYAVPMAKVENNQCSGCNMSLPTSTVKRVATGEGIVECENCGRILYA